MLHSAEIQSKHERIRQFLHANHLDGVCLSNHHNFAWVTGGGNNYINIATELGTATAMITMDRRFIVTTNIEHPRLMAEEGVANFFEVESYTWHDTHEQALVIRRHAAGKRIACDGGMPGMAVLPSGFDELRYTLQPTEIQRFRSLATDSGAIIGAVARSVEAGHSEEEIAGRLADGCHRHGLLPVVVLVAADDRVHRFRHPLPTAKRVEHYAELVLCARRHGLVAAVTRLVHLGPLPDDLRARHDAVMQVDAAAILATQPGNGVAAVFDTIRASYGSAGFADEWKLHHQGGLIGYQPREYLATPRDAHVIELNQAYAWNPSITGTKCEDTVLVTEHGPEVMTATKYWPTCDITIGGRTVARPDILVK